jgi:phage tail-like protein
MASQARTRELFQKFLFTVHDASGGIRTSKYQRASGLETVIGVAEYSEGGAFAPMKEPGRLAFGNITLERGISEDSDFYNWMNEVANMLTHMPEGAGSLTLDVLRDLYILQRDRTQKARIQYPLAACFPARFKPGEWDNTSDDVQVEEAEIAHWYNYREPA